MTTATAVPELTAEERMLRYGWRDVPRYAPDGTYLGTDQVPLTLDDLLHPQFGDHAANSTVHHAEVSYLTDAFRVRLRGVPNALVASDLGVYWGRSEFSHHSPDVSVILGVRDPATPRASFVCATEGTRPTLVVEVVSPDYRENDVSAEKKVGHYLTAGVEWYVIVDRLRLADPPRLTGRHRENGAWVMMEPDAEGRLYLPPVDAYLRVRGGRLECVVPETGEVIGDVVGYATQLDEIRAALEESDRRAEESDRRAEAERHAREAAERRAEAERLARAAAERRLAELEARLRPADPNP